MHHQHVPPGELPVLLFSSWTLFFMVRNPRTWHRTCIEEYLMVFVRKSKTATVTVSATP
jgi:hypothetical protein